MNQLFAMTAVTRGHASLGPRAGEVGHRLAAAAAGAVAEVLGLPVELRGRPLPAPHRPGAGIVALPLSLPALPDVALLEVEASLVARVVALVAGGEASPCASALTPLEHSALELLVLSALDGAAAVSEVTDLLAPRLAREGEAPRGGLVIELAVTAGPARGRAWLVVPHRAVALLAGPPELQEPVQSLPLFASLRGGGAPLRPEELAALSLGDVVLVDRWPADRHRLVFPGGFTAVGEAAGEAFTVQETTMDDRLARIPVVLELELARVPLTLADVARIAPGATLPLHLDRRGLVTLRLGERPVARGELVDVDGAVGVRILSLEVGP